MLLGHRSGIPDWITPAVVDEITHHPTNVWKIGEILDLAAAQPPMFAPGTGYSYSNTNYNLLAKRPPKRGTRVRAGPGACKIPASARVEAEVGDELGRLSLRNDRGRVGAVQAEYRNQVDAGLWPTHRSDPQFAS